MRRLALFARWPAAGEVKTRLLPAVPAPLACDLYRAMLEDAIAVAAEADVEERFLYWAGAPAVRDGLAVPPGFRSRDQQGRDLGARMACAFDELLATPDDRAVILGADCPALEASVVRDGFEGLGSHDLVLGPAHDGGYTLVGLRRRAPGLFRDVDWGTPRVLDRTLELAARAGLDVELLPALEDLDTPEDLVRWIVLRAGGGGPRAPRAVDRALRAIGLLPPG